jgi:hypothetical protein
MKVDVSERSGMRLQHFNTHKTTNNLLLNIVPTQPAHYYYYSLALRSM